MRVLGIDPGYALVGWAVLDLHGAYNSSLSLHKSGSSSTLSDIKSADLTLSRKSNGVGELIACGVIETEPRYSASERLETVFNDLKSLIDQYKPELAGIETLIHFKNAKTVMGVSEARGVILLALQQSIIPVTQVTPLQVKSAVTGYGKADKKQVQNSIKQLFKLENVIKPDDAADAVAVALCAAWTGRVPRI